MEIKDIPLIGMLGALLMVTQITLAFLPNIELITLLIILFTLLFKKKVVYIISVFIVLQGITYGFGLWWINYLYIWFILAILVAIFSKEKSPFIWAFIAGFYGLFFGALCAIPYFFIGLSGGSMTSGFQLAFAYWISGIPFDLVHGVSNFFIALLLFKPLYTLLNRFHIIYYQK